MGRPVWNKIAKANVISSPKRSQTLQMKKKFICSDKLIVYQKSWMNKVGSFQRVWSLLGVVCAWNSNHALFNAGVILISESSKISQHHTGLQEVQWIYIYVITCPGMTSRRYSTWTMVKFTRAIVFQAVLPTHLQPGRLKPVDAITMITYSS